MPDETRGDVSIADQGTTKELEALIRAADPELQSVVRAYEPLDVAYRNATSSDEVFPSATNTTALPRSLVTTVISAR